MSSKYDQSGTELSILPPQGLPFDVLQPTEQTATSVAPEVASKRNQTTPLRKVISRRHFFSSFFFFLNKRAFTRRDFSILSYVGNLFTSRRPRCSESFLLKGWGSS